MKKFLLISFSLVSALTHAQNKDKLTHAIDVDAIRQTELTGDIGLRPTIMSAAANTSKVESYLKKFPAKKYFTFPETRENSIRLLDGLPEKWLSYNAKDATTFAAVANPGEYFVFQVGVYTPTQSLKNIQVKFSYLIKNMNHFTHAQIVRQRPTVGHWMAHGAAKSAGWRKFLEIST